MFILSVTARDVRPENHPESIIELSDATLRDGENHVLHVSGGHAIIFTKK